MTDPSIGVSETANYIKIENCRPGIWRGDFCLRKFPKQERVEELSAFAVGLTAEEIRAPWREIPEWVGVDVAMAAILDFKQFALRTKDGTDTFYEEISGATWERKDRQLFACLKEGVVSDAGWGDGAYPIYLRKSGKVITGIKVVFLDKKGLSPLPK